MQLLNEGLLLFVCLFVFLQGFNLLLCYYALGDKDKMKKGFQKLLTVNLGIDDEDKYTVTGVNAKSQIIR